MPDQRKPLAHRPGAPATIQPDADDVGTMPTRPAMNAAHAHQDRPLPVVSKDEEAVNMLQAEYPGAPRWGLEVLHKVGKVESTQGEHGTILTDHGERISQLEEAKRAAQSMRPKALTLTGMSEDEVAHSFSQAPEEEQRAAVAKGLVRNHKQTRNQTIGGITALVVAVGGILGTVSHMLDTYQQRQDAHASALAAAASDAAQRAAREGAAEAVRETPPQILPVPVLAPAAVPSGALKR